MRCFKGLVEESSVCIGMVWNSSFHAVRLGNHKDPVCEMPIDQWRFESLTYQSG